MLAEFADSDGIIKRRRAGMVLRELDAIEAMIREHGTLALNNIIEESSEWTVNAINKGVGITISSGTFNAVNRHVEIGRASCRERRKIQRRRYTRRVETK